MKITQEGNKVRLQMMERLPNNEWKKLFDFTIYKSEYKEVKKHIIDALNNFWCEN